MKRIRILPASFLLALISISACSREPETDRDTLVCSTFSKAFCVFNDVLDHAETAIRMFEDTLASVAKSNFPLITVSSFDSVTWPKTLILDYGDTLINIGDGIFRKGKINIVYDKFYDTEGCHLVLNTSDYELNGHAVSLTASQDFQGKYSGEKSFYLIQFDLSLITEPALQMQADVRRDWVSGAQTAYPLLFDDYFLCDVSAKGIISSYGNFTLSITDMLHMARFCYFPLAGKTEIQAEGKSTRIIDFGNGYCDPFAVMYEGTVATEFQMQP